MTALDFLKAMSYTNSGSTKEFLKTPIVNIDGECRGLVVVTPSVIPISVSEVSEKMVSVEIIKKKR